MSVFPLRDQIISDLRTNVPSLQDVQGHDGNFNLEEIQRQFGHHSRAARVVVTAFRNAEEHGMEPVAEGDFSVFVACRKQLTTDPDGAVSPGDAAMLIAGRVVEVVWDVGRSWGGIAYGEPQNVDARNLYSGRLIGIGIALWVVTWEQAVLYDGRSVANPDKLKWIETDWDLDGDEDTAESEQETGDLNP